MILFSPAGIDNTSRQGKARMWWKYRDNGFYRMAFVREKSSGRISATEKRKRYVIKLRTFAQHDECCLCLFIVTRQYLSQ